MEIYENAISVTDATADAQFQSCYRCFHHLGSGELILFNNRLTPLSGHSAVPLEFTHYRDTVAGSDPMGQCDGLDTDPPDGNRSPTATYRGYPCWRQPGRMGDGTMAPMYAWNNYFTDTLAKADLVYENPGGYGTEHFVANRDYYNAVSKDAQTSSSAPFDGTTGMGFGTLARRPATCTPTSEAADAGYGGVGYFDTDTNTLYHCSATDTWAVQYQPYTYPHPLTLAAGGSANLSGSISITGGVTIQ
jgi:hypothetical protein